MRNELEGGRCARCARRELPTVRPGGGLKASRVSRRRMQTHKNLKGHRTPGSSCSIQIKVKEVKMKWKKLRDSYRDALKRQNEMLAKEPTNSAKKNYPWKYMKPMQFLQPHMSVRKKPLEDVYPALAPDAVPDGAPELASEAAHNGVEPHTSDESESEVEAEAEAESSAKRRNTERLAFIDRKLDYLCKAQSKRQCTEAHLLERGRPPPAAPDPLDIFFNSMCQSTKRFPYPTQIKIKRTVFEAVIAAEEALIAEQQSYASLWARGGGSSSSSSGDVDADAGSAGAADGAGAGARAAAGPGDGEHRAGTRAS